jgi:hypothetical protein
MPIDTINLGTAPDGIGGNTLTVTWAANGMFQITVPTAA